MSVSNFSSLYVCIGSAIGELAQAAIKWLLFSTFASMGYHRRTAVVPIVARFFMLTCFLFYFVSSLRPIDNLSVK